MQRGVFFMVLIVFSAGTVMGQLKLSFEDNAYRNADFQPFILADNKLDEGPAGPNQVWDFSSLTTTGEVVSYMMDAKEQPACILFPEANIVIRENKYNYFFRVSPEGMDEYGNSCAAFTVIYDTPIKKFPFPFTYGSSISGNFHGYLYNKPESTVQGYYSTEADGYGTLLLPGNTVIHDVLRVKFVRQRDVVEGATVCYRWYARNSDPVTRYPLLSLTKYENGEKSNVYRVAYYALARQLASNTSVTTENPTNIELITTESSQYDLSLSPNPFSDVAQIRYNLPEDSRVLLEAFDNLGRKVATPVNEHQAKGIHTLPFSGNELFIYFIRLTVNGNVVSVKKLIHLNQK